MCDGTAIEHLTGRRDVTTHCCSDDLCNSPDYVTVGTTPSVPRTTSSGEKLQFWSSNRLKKSFSLGIQIWFFCFCFCFIRTGMTNTNKTQLACTADLELHFIIMPGIYTIPDLASIFITVNTVSLLQS